MVKMKPISNGTLFMIEKNLPPGGFEVGPLN